METVVCASMKRWTPAAMSPASARHSSTMASSMGRGGREGSVLGGQASARPSLPDVARPSSSVAMAEDVDAALAHLYEHWARVNREKFDDLLPRDFSIAFNPLLRRLTGRITYGWKLVELSLDPFSRYGPAARLAT